MLPRLIIVFVGSFCVFTSLKKIEATDQYSGHQIWRIFPKTNKDINLLRSLSDSNPNFDFWKVPVASGRPVDIQVPPDSIDYINSFLKSNGLEYSVNINDVQQLIDDERQNILKQSRATSLDDFDYSVYHPPEEIYDWITWMVDEYSYITKVQVAVTYEGRPVYALEISKPGGPGAKPKVYLDALTHSPEWITTATAMWTLNEMLTNPTWQHMVDNFDWYFIPMLNVDGYVETWTGDRLWRRTRSSGASSECVGADANRNWDEEHWGGDGSSADPCSRMYHGPKPNSESEIRHLEKYIIEKGDVDALVTLHSYSQFILYPYGWTLDLSPDAAELDATAKRQSEAISEVHQKNYVYGPWSSTLYISSGDTMDWAYSVAGIKYSFTYELRDEGEYGFLLPADQIIPNAEEFIAGLDVLIRDMNNAL